MNPASLFLLVQPFLLLAFGFAIYLRCQPTRRQAEQRAADLLSQFPDAAQESEVLPLRGTFQDGKQREIDDRVGQQHRHGWTLLRVTAVNPLISIHHWGGAVRLHFVREASQSNASSFQVE